MSALRMELASSHGDQTLGAVRYVVHATANATDTLSIVDAGLIFTEGRSTISTDLVRTHGLTGAAGGAAGGTMLGEPGSVVVCEVPPNFHVGYGVQTDAFIDRGTKQVTGAPMLYAAARQQLAFYLTPDTEAARKRVEAQLTGGYTLDQLARYQLDPKYIIGHFAPDGGLPVLLRQLDEASRSFEPVDVDRMALALRDVMVADVTVDDPRVLRAMRSLVVGTIESTVMSLLRMMRWSGLADIGYSFMEGQQAVAIAAAASLPERRKLIDAFANKMAGSQLFAGEFGWLIEYAGHELELMRVELHAAELDAQS